MNTIHLGNRRPSWRLCGVWWTLTYKEGLGRMLVLKDLLKTLIRQGPTVYPTVEGNILSLDCGTEFLDPGG